MILYSCWSTAVVVQREDGDFLCHAGVGVSRIAPDPVLNIGVLEIFSRRRRLDSDLDWKGLDGIFRSPLLDP